MRLYKSQELAKDKLIVLPVPNLTHFAGWVIQLCQPFVDIRVTSRLRTTRSCAPEPTQSIDQDCLQPPAEGAWLTAMIEFAKVLRYGQQYLLD